MNSVLKQYTRPAFLICVGVLAFFVGGMAFMQHGFEILLDKEHIMPKKPFDQLDTSKLHPFKEIMKSKIEDKEILESLGTEDYLKLVIEDTETVPVSSTSRFTLFITYYGKADAVPHVPEECYTGGGFKKNNELSEAIIFNLPESDLQTSETVRKVPGQYIVFEKARSEFWEPVIRFPVAYFFVVNGKLANTRTEARMILAGNFRGKHSYFSKVEMIFNASANDPPKEEVKKACEKLLSVLLPVLLQDHYPSRADLMAK